MFGPGNIMRAFNVQRTGGGAGPAFTTVQPFVAVIPPWAPNCPVFTDQISGVNSVTTTAVGGQKVNMANNQGKRLHVTKVCYTTAATAHLVSILRPLNWTLVASAVAAGATTIPLIDDPGVYSTNYKYGTANGIKPAQANDRVCASGDYIVSQMADGTWFAARVTSSSGGNAPTLTLTQAIPSTTSAIGIAKYTKLFLMGQPTDINPADGQVQPSQLIAASLNRDVGWSDPYFGVVSALEMSTPLLFYSPNTTNAGVLEGLWGVITDR